MCGIVGILGKDEAAPILLEALRQLEYRGYDSAGIATIDEGRLRRRRAEGKLANLSERLAREPVAGKTGIGHTRWATHGKPSEENAHPHQIGSVSIVHNGIIENYRELRAELTSAGCTFQTETDTEAVAQLCARFLQDGLEPVDAATKTVDRLRGSYALCFLFKGEEDLIVGACHGSALVVGHGDGEMFVASDTLALATMTNRVSYLEDGDIAIVTRAGVTVLDSKRKQADRPRRIASVDASTTDKGHFRHYMLKEIHEQPTLLAKSFEHYSKSIQLIGDKQADRIDYSIVDRIVLSGCGTAFYACLVARYWFEKLAGIPVDLDLASEFRYREPPLSDRSIAFFVSQSGETADTLSAMRYAKETVSRTVAVVNVEESSLARESDVVLSILAGREISVASTKAFACQMATLVWQAIDAGRQRNTLEADGFRELVMALQFLPGLVNQVLDLEYRIAVISREFATSSGALFIGRGMMFPIALEGALKLKELSYIHAEGYAGGELKHGPISLVDEKMPVVVIAPTDSLFEKTYSNMQEVLARGGKTLMITDSSGAATEDNGCWHTLVLPKVHPVLAPILYSIPVQLLAYHTAATKGTDVDQPRNLAKSVTVE